MTNSMQDKVKAAQDRMAAIRAATAVRLGEKAGGANIEGTGVVANVTPEAPTQGTAKLEAADNARKLILPAQIAKGLMDLPTLIDVGDNEQDHVMLFGSPKTGKTTAAATLAEFYRVLWLDGDKGMKAIYDNLPAELLKRITPIRITDTPDYPMFVRTILKLVTGRATNLCTTHGVVDCPICKRDKAPMVTISLNALPANWVVVMDSQTQFVASACRHIVTQLYPGKEAPIDFKFEFDQWGSLKNIMDTFGSYLKELPCKVVTISHESMVKDEKGDLKLVPVAGSDNTSKYFAKNYGTVVFTRVVNGQHNFSSATTFDNRVQTGSRSNVALEDVETPSLLHIFEPKKAAAMLKGSWCEWFFKYGAKRQDPKTPKAPMPKALQE